MPESVTITLLGKPVPSNPMRRTASGVRFLPKRQAVAMDELKYAATQAMISRKMLDGPLQLTLVAEMPIPATWSKKKIAAAVAGEVWPTVKPDLKNLLALSEDALRSVVYKDDNIVCRHRAEKRYSAQPKVTITVEVIESWPF